MVDYKDEAELLLNNTLETELYTGDGQAYGLEFQLKKKRGKFTGFVSYTLSRVERFVEEINNGDPYPANWDKTHDISLVASYDATKRINFSSSFAYMTGRPITYPQARFEYGGVTAPIYQNRNGARTPAYHRLDLASTFNLVDPEKHKYTIDLATGVYNVYGRKNPYSIYFQQDQDNPEITKAFRLSIYAIPIPYITINFKF